MLLEKGGGIVDIPSNHSVDQTLEKLRAILEAKGVSVSVHVEVCKDIPAMAKRLHDLGARASVGINPETDVQRVLPFAAQLDMILIMSIHPGFGGQEFIPEALEKLLVVRRELDRHALKVDIAA
jgi:ribulose-phosphate 3-epimerase